MTAVASLPKSFTEAREQGSSLYFTGKPCKRGHISPRRTTNQNCVECQKGYCSKFYYENQEERTAVSRAYAKAHPEENTRRTKESWQRKTKEERSEYFRPYRLAYWARVRGSGGNVTSQEWAEVKERYGNKCLACGATERIEMDHVIPLSAGGRHEAGNIQPLCRSCNARKSDSTTDYRS